MKITRYTRFVRAQILRGKLRSLGTVGGVTVAMFLLTVVISMQRGVESATRVSANDTTLVVYRENRYCPFTSHLPQFYASRIAAIPGVASVAPMRIVVSNCRASLDVVTFRGLTSESVADGLRGGWQLSSGSIEEWRRRSDGALVGESLATRRDVEIGQRFTAAGITVHVAGILRSSEPQDRNVVYTHLPFLQETDRRGGSGGIVTQFNVRVTDSDRLEEIARAIDEEFASESQPTSTWPEKAFAARAAADVLEIARFATWLGWGALITVFALVANAIVLSVRERVREYAILETLGYSKWHIATFVVAEGSILSLVGGMIGAALAAVIVRRGVFVLTMEGVSIEMTATAGVLLGGVLLSGAIGVLASVVPAVQAARQEIVESFRTV